MRLIEGLRTGRTIVLVEDDMDAVFALATTELISTRCNNTSRLTDRVPSLAGQPLDRLAGEVDATGAGLCSCRRLDQTFGASSSRTFHFRSILTKGGRHPGVRYTAPLAAAGVLASPGFDCSIALCSHERLRNIQNRPPLRRAQVMCSSAPLR
jgi:hypothetical protein